MIDMVYINIFVTTFIFILSPGPGLAIILARSFTSGFWSAYALSLGMLFGDGIYVVLVLLSLSNLTEIVAPYLPYIRLFGAGYLIYLGISQIRGGVIKIEKENKHYGYVSSFFLGAVVVATNPKAAVFYLGFFPLFVDVTTLTLQTASYIFLAWFLAILSAITLFTILTAYAGQKISNPHTMKIVGRVVGTLMIGAAVALLIT